MINQYLIRAAVALAIITTFTTKTVYQSIQKRIHDAKAQYESLCQKWEPALSDLSQESLKIVIKNKSAALKDAYENAVTEAEAKRLKALRDDLKALPIQFICAELDADIQTILRLQKIAPKLLNNDLDDDNAFDASSFQQLRAAIDTFPCTLKEQQDCKKMGDVYKYFLAFFGGVLIANHFSLLPVNTPSNA